MEDLLPFPSPEYFVFLAILLASRAMDFFSTWVATPHLVLEGNPIARRLGWRWGIPLNVALCGAFALHPMTAIILSTTSLLVAARNFHNAWLMRSLGEHDYRFLVSEQIHRSGKGLYLLCMYAQAALTAVVGVALILFSGDRIIPVSIGLGVAAYSAAVAVFSTLSVWRVGRRGD